MEVRDDQTYPFASRDHAEGDSRRQQTSRPRSCRSGTIRPLKMLDQNMVAGFACRVLGHSSDCTMIWNLTWSVKHRAWAGANLRYTLVSSRAIHVQSTVQYYATRCSR